jgi:hypothetical protein
MAWRTPFVDALTQRTTSIAYILEVVTVYDEPGVAFTVASHPGLGGSERCYIGAAPGSPRVRVEGAALAARTWQSTIGAFFVGMVGDLGELCQHITRGTVVQLKAGFAGMSAADFEPIAIGQVKNIRGRAPAWTIECHDVVTAFRQRLTADYAVASLFYNVAASTTVSTSWSPGVSTLVVASTTNFDRDTGGTGAIRVTPASPDAPFYLTYSGTGTGPVRFTGISAAAVLGTLEVAVAGGVGLTVEEVFYLAGHPLDIARRVLVSRTGTAANGPYDVYPEGCGLGLLHTMIDHEDVDRYRDTVVVASSGSYAWAMAVEEAEEDALAWLSSVFLARAGLFLAVRQGLITVRAAQNTQAATYRTAIEITDDDIAEIVSYEAYDYRHNPEYARVYIATGSGGNTSTSSRHATLPARGSLDYDLSDRVWANEAAIQDDAIGRLAESAERIPERLVLRCKGRRLSQLAPGDIVTLTTTRTHSRRDGSAGWAGRSVMVEQVACDWEGGTVEIGVLIYPESSDVFA